MIRFSLLFVSFNFHAWRPSCTEFIASHYLLHYFAHLAIYTECKQKRMISFLQKSKNWFHISIHVTYLPMPLFQFFEISKFSVNFDWFSLFLIQNKLIKLSFWETIPYKTVLQSLSKYNITGIVEVFFFLFHSFHFIK